MEMIHFFDVIELNFKKICICTIICMYTCICTIICMYTCICLTICMYTCMQTLSLFSELNLIKTHISTVFCMYHVDCLILSVFQSTFLCKTDLSARHSSTGDKLVAGSLLQGHVSGDQGWLLWCHLGVREDIKMQYLEMCV